MTAVAPGTQRRSLEGLLRTLAAMSPDTSALGSAFESVADLALWSSPEFGARIKQIWRWEDWPGARGRDLGIDRVISTIDGELWAVQAKGYGSGTSLTYSGKTGIATFLAAAGTGQFAMKLVVTSSDSVADNARQIAARQSVPTRILDRSWLESLDIDWPRGLAEVRDAVAAAAGGEGPAQIARAAGRHNLAPHQKAAVKDVLTSLDTQSTEDSRAKLLMPCGTGKTVTCHAVAEELGAQQVLVLVPSLSLLAQTMRAWQSQSQGRLRVIAVCSDESVVARGNDDIVMDPSEILAPVTTDPNALASFLVGSGAQATHELWPTVVFCTYHSSPVVAAAQELVTRLDSHSFDLAVADEAHYLAGNVSKTFATVLDATKIRARRRLFATATPRIVSTKLKDTLAKDGRDHDVVSMDDPDIFGPVAHELRFSEALADGLLTDYQVVVLGIDDADVVTMVDRRRLLKLDGEEEVITDAATLAAAIATYRTVTEHGAKRLVSYHSRIVRAEEFTRLLSTIGPSLPSGLAAHVSAHTIKGTMPAGKRREILNRLAHEAPDSGIPTACVVANARCLTEGVDIPTLDGVVFVDPRRSRIDVVQSVGRAIRRADNKTRGLVVIPVALSRDDDSETSLAGSAFSRVWDVLGALRDHDDALADELDALRTELGRRGTLDRGALSKIRLDLPTWAGPEFAEAIRLKMVEHTTSSFHHNLGLLQAFADENRHANVPNKYVVEGVTLGRWVSVQRGNKDTLPTDRRTQLESVQGWSWDARAAMWEEKLAALHAFVARMGHAIVPQGYEENGIKLGIWVNEQRTNHDRDKLTDERRAKLQAVQGWSWDPYEDAWNRGYEALVTYAAHTGHTRVPKVYDQGGVNLGSWVGEQRSNYRKGRLSDERRAKLEAIPSWSWDAIADSWNSRLAALQAFVVRESHARVPAEHDENGVPLGSWVRTQRKKREKLTDEQRALLEAFPRWSWDPWQDQWAENFAVLTSYVDRESSARVPDGYVEVLKDGAEVKLGSWVREQRSNRNTLTPERREKLEALHEWTWLLSEDFWADRLALLHAYAERVGNARVPQGYKENDVSLGSWVAVQRTKKNLLGEERYAQLEAVRGWSWDPAADMWAEKYAVLKKYAMREGTSKVPHSCKEGGVNIGSWAYTQRKNKDRLTDQQRTQLELLPKWSW